MAGKALLLHNNQNGHTLKSWQHTGIDSYVHFEGYTNDGKMPVHVYVESREAHKLADWIKENIPEPPPAPPEWRIATGDGEATLMIGDYQSVWLNKDGEFCGDSTASFSHGRITPALHKEMICALLDAHYELHKGES